MTISHVKKISYAETLTDDIFEHAESDVVDATIAKATAGLQQLIEVEIKLAIARYLGRSDFTLDELRGRCQRTVAPSGDETWFVDDTPVLLVYPSQLTEFDNRSKHVYEVQRSVRQLRF